MRRDLTDIARAIENGLQRTEALGLRILRTSMLYWIAAAKRDGGLSINMAIRAIDRHDAEVERILMARLARGVYTLSGPEQSPRRSPPSKEAA